MQDTHNSKLDRWGVFWSIACAIHCLAIPFAAFMAPTLAVYLRHELIHFFLFAIVLPVAFFALWKPRRIHKSNWPVALGSIGLGFLLVSLFIEYFFEVGHFDAGHLHETTHNESILTIFGSLFLVAAHLLNLKLHRERCKHEHHELKQTCAHLCEHDHSH